MKRRRDMFELIFAAVLAPIMILGAPCCAGPTSEIPEPKRNSNIGYINPEVPTVKLPEYMGKRYEALVPDTLDLAERAELGIHALTNLVDPETDYEYCHFADFTRNPPILLRSWESTVCTYKYMQSLTCLRLLTGSRQNLEIDKRWRETSLQQIGPDGLAYWPMQGRPWGSLEETLFSGNVIGDSNQGQFCPPAFLGRLMGAMAIYWLQDGNPVWKQSVERMIERLSQLAVEKEDYAYFPVSFFAPGVEISQDLLPMSEPFDRSQLGWLIEGLGQYYRVTGYQPARDLGEKLARYLKDHAGIYDPQGAFIGFDHFHHHTAGMLGMADLALATGNRQMAEFIRKCYEYGKGIMDPLVGYCPEGCRKPNPDGTYSPAIRSGSKHETAEACGTADIIAIGLKLTEMGYDECWDDVDRWLRGTISRRHRW